MNENNRSKYLRLNHNYIKYLLECYSKDLCYLKVQHTWNENNHV